MCAVSLLAASATEPPPVDPGPDSRCPVCGMFVAKYPGWTAQVEFTDGSVAFFDGPKDMFRFLLDMDNYRSGAVATQPDRVFVTDYYRLKRFDARTALYVAGSNVLGPMGKELIPFDTEEAAAEFMSDHNGARILRFSQVDRDCISRLK